VQNISFQSFFSKNILYLLIFLILLISINFITGSYFKDNFLNIIWEVDEPWEVSVADNFHKNKTLDSQYLPVVKRPRSTNDLINLSDYIGQPISSKGPLYFILLGLFYEIFSTPQKDLYLFGSIFTNILSSIFIVLYFFLIKRKFGFKISFFSSLVIVISPYFAYQSIGITHEALLYIFLISAFFFLEKKTSHYVIFGILSGFAHLTHPLGIILPISYIIFLLISKNFRGSLVVTLLWILMLIPWFIRNIFVFGDLGAGLYIPFSAKASKIILDIFLPTSQISSTQMNLSNTLVGGFLDPILLFKHWYEVFFSETLSMSFLVIFILIFTGFCFFSLEKLRKYKLFILSMVTITFGSIIVLLITHITYVNIFIVFFLPVIFIFILWKKKGFVFQKNLDRFYPLVLMFSIINLGGVYYLYHFWGLVEARFIMFSIFLAIPLSFIGFHKIGNYFTSNKNSIVLTKFTNFFFVIIVSIMLIEMVSGYAPVNNFEYYTPPGFETQEVKQINSWIISNLNTSKNGISNSESTLWLRTGIDSVGIPVPIPSSTEEEFEFFYLLEKFQISYLVFYDESIFRPDPANNGQREFFNYLKSPASCIYLNNLKTIGNSYVFKIETFRSQHLVDKIISQINLRNFEETLKQYYCLLLSHMYYNDNKSLQKTVDEFIVQYMKMFEEKKAEIRNYLSQERYFHVINLYNRLVETHNQVISMENHFTLDLNGKIPFINTVEAQNVLYQNLIMKAMNQEDFDDVFEYYDLQFKSTKSLKLLYPEKELNEKLIQIQLNIAELGLKTNSFNDAEKAINAGLGVDRFNPEIWQLRAQMMEELGRLPEALDSWEMVYKFKQDKMGIKEKIDELEKKIDT